MRTVHAWPPPSATESGGGGSSDGDDIAPTCWSRLRQFWGDLRSLAKNQSLVAMLLIPMWFSAIFGLMYLYSLASVRSSFLSATSVTRAGSPSGSWECAIAPHVYATIAIAWALVAMPGSIVLMSEIYAHWRTVMRHQERLLQQQANLVM